MNRVEYILQCAVASVSEETRLWSDVYRSSDYWAAEKAFSSDQYRKQELNGTIFRIVCRETKETILIRVESGCVIPLNADISKSTTPED